MKEKDKKLYTPNHMSQLAKFLKVGFVAISNWKAGKKAGKNGDDGVKRKFKLTMIGFNVLCKEVHRKNYKNIDEALDAVMKKHNVVSEIRKTEKV